MLNLLNYIRSLTPFSDESWELLQGALTKRDYKKKEFLLQKEEVCQSLFFIDKGYCKSYVLLDGGVKNTAFYFENEVATDIQSFGSGEKSVGNLVACEPVTAILFHKERLFQLAEQSLEIQALGRNCLRVFATKQEEFSNLFKLYTAQQRLEYVEKNHPQISQRVSLTQLSSFLGVSRETLSRIRKRRSTR